MRAQTTIPPTAGCASRSPRWWRNPFRSPLHSPPGARKRGARPCARMQRGESPMKAAVLHELKKPLAIDEVERPRPGHGEVLIKVEACGVCHSDLHIVDGDWKQFGGITKIPLVPGHEVAGRVAEVGDGVRDLKLGDRVGVPWIFWTCGECEFCGDGYENLCSRQKITGLTEDGGYAEYIKAPATHATKIPGAISAAEAA